MIIKRIDLCNFRQFKGNQHIEFSVDENRNITLVLGDNTSGKTTLLQAFLWCMYDKANFKTKEALLNQLVMQEIFESKKNDLVSVTVTLIHHDVEYYITRELKYSYVNGEVKSDRYSNLIMSFKEKDGQTTNFQPYQLENKIEEILPQDLSTYFFYDTERFGNITTKEDVTESVKGLLGLTVLENTMGHIGRGINRDTVVGRLRASLSKHEDSNSEKILKETQDAENLKKDLEERVKLTLIEKENYRKKVEEYQAILRGLEESSQIQREKERKERGLINERESLDKERANFIRNFNSDSFVFFASPLIKKALNQLTDAKVTDKGIRDMNANSIRHIIQRGKCVCGSEIEEGNEFHAHLLQELEYLPPKSIGLLINSFVKSVKAYQRSEASYYENISKSYTDILKNKKRIAVLDEEVKYLSDKVRSIASTANYERDLINSKNALIEKEKKIDQLNIKIGEQANIIKQNTNKYNLSISASEKNKEIHHQIEYALNIYDWVKSSYESKESSIREKLEERVNYYFQKIYHGNRKVEINEKYRVNLITTEGNEDFITDESQGLETVKNFSFIAGLVDLARNKIFDNNDDVAEIESDAFPLILDAPFSNADERHVSNIAKVLPEVAEQLVLIVMAKDWNYAEKEMSSLIGKRYYLDKISEVHSSIREA